MGYPVITRLGRNQFWYKKWYTDFSYSELFKKITTFEALLSFYFYYGILNAPNANLFYLYRWYKCTNNHANPNSNFNSYFRRYYYNHQTLAIEHTYTIRLKTLEYFPLRTYALKYSNWIILSIQWFKPVKVNYFRKNNSSSNKLKPIISKNKLSNSLNNRTKLVYYLALYNLSGNNLNYYF